MSLNVDIFILFLIQFVLNFLIYIKLDNLSGYFNIFDLPDRKLKIHKKITPLIGGIIIFLNLFFFIIISLIINFDFLPLELTKKEQIFFYFLIISLFGLGIYDDKFNLIPKIKLSLAIVIIFLTLLINEKLIIKSISLSFYDSRIFFDSLKIFVTVLCILLFIHASNLFDVINLQTILYFVIIFFYLLLYSNFKYICLILLISLIFSLYLNFKNYLFLGDSGVYLLSSISAFIFIYEYNEFNTIIYADEIFVLMMVPGLDMLRLVIMRALKGNNIFSGDRNHIHHLLIKRYSLIKTNLIIFVLIIGPILLFKITNLKLINIILFFIIVYTLLISFFIK